MNKTPHVFKYALLIGLMTLASGCVVAPAGGYHEGYWDREHNRYWSGNGWHSCAEHGEYCR